MRVPRVQFTVSNNEFAELQRKTIAEGFPTVAEFCKCKALDSHTGYTDLYLKLKMKIQDLAPGTVFILSDIIATPPALMGRLLCERVKDGSIRNIEQIGSGPVRYRKLPNSDSTGDDSDDFDESMLRL